MLPSSVFSLSGVEPAVNKKCDIRRLKYFEKQIKFMIGSGKWTYSVGSGPDKYDKSNGSRWRRCWRTTSNISLKCFSPRQARESWSATWFLAPSMWEMVKEMSCVEVINQVSLTTALRKGSLALQCKEVLQKVKISILKYASLKSKMVVFLKFLMA